MDKDILQAAAKAYEQLIKVEYLIVLGRKGKTSTMHITFQPENFYHLAGLHKLKLRYKFQQKTSAKILANIVKGQLTVSQIENDDNFRKIVPRLIALQNLSTILENNDTKFFAYDNRKVSFATKITADYLAKGSYDSETITFSFFVKDEAGTICMNSIFPMEKFDYSSRQTQYTVLFKKRIEHHANNVTEEELYRHKNFISDEGCLTSLEQKPDCVD
ncbi:PBECR4 domain-containing protein [Selenomonas ruminis]|uniref:Phage-Barnase-EndoU-ColicinE5/D-RelE like nuclease 4 domain-containing protein n=1 Tax=Selenomonas ruminis TaxID=2593411 RepID=A0A5D6VXT7_9FIRM|nr:PBECR4 domain-containing protein [Selenomonas sp. mPRGC5]TYZ20476.1 hypothetical protein FZ040_11690 [Selenomonas sp. mPRGC5]